ncbi:MAG: redox-sensing transcriptional repressor Rex [Acidimicrobiales bacterium]
MDQPVSEATVGRLPAYLRSLVELAGDDVASVPSGRLAELVGVNPATLRRDLSSLGITGTRGVGYDVKYLLFEISVVLGVNQEWPVAVVGSGNLGRALANYQGLASRGFPVRVLFDIDETLVGTKIGQLTVQHGDRIPELVREHAITVGVIATSIEAAQSVADQLVGSGVTSILNFTAESISVPDHVVVRRVDLATELQILSFYQQRDTAVSGGGGLPLGGPAD